ncbi:MAG: tRNA pseudouridine(55) synthase TruB [Ruminococcaceae bacterium]|nr:tRNA pseudouridine(55) synthase TruB [Oscillospiraceae bacterium]
MNGVIVINKEEDFTSFDVVAVVRRTLHTKKVGHCGTLDPNATGVLPVLVGNATKAQDIIVNHDKSYVATFKLGLTSDTLDIWGEVAEENGPDIKKEELEKALKNFVGDILQVPPMYSAVQKDGVRLYELARQGIEVEREARPVTIYSLELNDFDEKAQCGTLTVSCSKGTYIRTLISDIAKSLGTNGIMTSLVRTSACGFTLSQAITLSELKELAQNGEVENHLLSLESLFESYSELFVSEKQTVRFRNGNPLDIERTELKDIKPADGTVYRVKSGEGEFLALGVVDLEKGVLKIYKHFGK